MSHQEITFVRFRSAGRPLVVMAILKPKSRKALVCIGLLAVIVLAFAGLSAFSRGKPPTGLAGDGRLSPCPDSPNCVCSEADSLPSSIAPLAFTGSPDTARANLLRAIAASGGTVQTQDGDYISATYRTAVFRFIDDLECRIDTASKLIHVRSASRVGRSDLGVNRRRAARLRAAFVAQQSTASRVSK